MVLMIVVLFVCNALKISLIPKNEVRHQIISFIWIFSVSFLFPGISNKLLLFALFVHNNSWRGHCLRFDAFVRCPFYVDFWLKLYWTCTYTIINIIMYFWLLFLNSKQRIFFTLPSFMNNIPFFPFLYVCDWLGPCVGMFLFNKNDAWFQATERIGSTIHTRSSPMHH